MAMAKCKSIIGFFETEDNSMKENQNLKKIPTGMMVKIKVQRTLKTVMSLSVKVRSADANRTTLAEVVRHASALGFNPQTVIDVGVANGTDELYETFPQAKHLLVEPLAEWESALINISKKYNADYVIAAASDTTGNVSINVHKDFVGSSLLKESDGSIIDGVSREIPVDTLDNMCAKRKMNGPYLIKVDVQGAELKVLDGAKNLLAETEMVLLEVSLFDFHKGGPQFYDIVSYMKKNGFVVYDIYGGLNRPFDGALAQVDLAFVKESGLFKRNNFYRKKPPNFS